MSKAVHIIKHELLELLPPTAFFFIAFHLIALSRNLMRREYGISLYSMTGATIGALLVAKVIVLADLLPFINRFPKKPLICNTLWKTAIYSIAALLLHYLEEIIPLWFRLGDFAAAQEKLVKEVVWPHFWAVQLWLFTLFLVYNAAHELVRVLGPQQVGKLFFGFVPKAIASPEI
ncbi:MAG TPA: hypothetical protein VM008_16855 [Phycisphaerae bacterium]|nr:hypothetical protein [Phycisphaerae bacterium]